MAVINTNYLALVSQNNLTKSQSQLGQAIERLSSGLRINSAKDDAAGQAIANRFTANIKGLSQAARNSNDGISIAQTTEGALTEVNNNLQRIRELTVQAANGSNSPSDLQSIQDEINQRLDEITRVSDQTQFNGIQVLAKDGTLTIQVGSRDSETIDVNLRQINRTTLGLDSLDMTNQFVTKDAAGNANFAAANATLFDGADLTAVNDTLKPVGAATWTSFTDTFSGAATFSGFAINEHDNTLYAVYVSAGTTSHYHAATFNTTTGSITVSANSTAAAGGTVSFNTNFSYFEAGSTGGGAVSFGQLSISNITTSDPTVTGYFMLNSGGATSFFAQLSDGNYYEAAFNAATGSMTIDLTTGSDGTNNPKGVAITADTYLDGLPSSAINIDYTTVDAAIGGTNTVAQNSAGDYFVVNTSGGGTTTYYEATLNDDLTSATAGALTLVSTTPIQMQVDTTAIDTALGGTNVLMNYKGSGLYVQNTDADGNVAYYAAELSAGGTTATLAGANPAEAQIMVDPLDALDKALQQVDNLRSELGAVQNRFESTIANLNNTVNNLSAARSRIEDADYAVEVSNMTRAQILQQAGTAVLAQANQVPQTMLSLLG